MRAKYGRVSWPDAASFEARARATSPTSTQCALHAASSHGIRNLWQGSFSLIEDDLGCTLGAKAAAESTAALIAAGVKDAFSLRRELVNFKKACLRLFHDADRVHTDLKRQDMYFFRNTGAGHVRDGCCAVAADGTACAPICETLQRAKGLVVAVHDARDYAKHLCELPRHPDDLDQALSTRLRRMPHSFKASVVVRHAEDFVASSRPTTEGGAPPLPPAPTEECSSTADAPAATDCAAAGEAEEALPPARLRESLAAVLGVHRRLLPWPEHVHDFVRLSLIARGGAKACSIRVGLDAYLGMLRQTQARTCAALAALGRVDEEAALRLQELDSAPPCASPVPAADPTADAAAELAELSGPSSWEDERTRLVRRRLHTDKHTHRLTGLRQANELFLRILGHLAERHQVRADPAEPAAAVGHKAADPVRLFVAGDVTGHSMFFPPAFAAVGALLAEVAAAARRYDLLQREAIAAEGWPPPASARRTRVHTDGTLRCWRCDRTFSRHWITRDVCWECEAAVRSSGACAFDERARGGAAGATGSAGRSATLRGGRAATHHGVTFCPHQGKCVACHGGFGPCAACRLSQGDGEAVASLCASLCAAAPPAETAPPLHLFLDFDRSLASTRGGGSPLQGTHSVDPELAGLAALHPTHVITRNSHAAEIATFLELQGVPVQGVVVVRKGESKATAMLRTLPALAAEEPEGARPAPTRAVFVDDGVQEVCDERVATLPGLFRVLFRRGGVI